MRRKLTQFFIAVALMGVVGGLYEPTFNNYLADVFGIGAEKRGMIELPREMPGFLVTLVAGALAAVALNRAAAVAMLVVAAGLVGLAFTPGHFTALMIFMVIWSVGAHLSMPVMNSITLSFASAERRASSLGKMSAVSIFGTILGAGLVTVLMPTGVISYRGAYLIAAACAVAAAVAIISMGRIEKPGQRRRTVFVFKRRYGLYYALCAFFGARKQIFMTFGPWVIVTMFKQPPQMIAGLWIVFSVLGLFLQPLVGRAIDHWGERMSLVTEGIVLAVVCTMYSIAGLFAPSQYALWVVMAAYVVDQMCFSVSMARTTYLSRIIEKPEDLPGGLAAGVSIDHAVSMSIPLVGGVAWALYGFQYVFWAAGLIALGSSALSLLITAHTREAAPEGEPA